MDVLLVSHQGKSTFSEEASKVKFKRHLSGGKTLRFLTHRASYICSSLVLRRDCLGVED